MGNKKNKHATFALYCMLYYVSGNNKTLSGFRLCIKTIIFMYTTFIVYPSLAP